MAKLKKKKFTFLHFPELFELSVTSCPFCTRHVSSRKVVGPSCRLQQSGLTQKLFELKEYDQTFILVFELKNVYLKWLLGSCVITHFAHLMCQQ